jgi:hypothetical protein
MPQGREQIAENGDHSEPIRRAAGYPRRKDVSRRLKGWGRRTLQARRLTVPGCQVQLCQKRIFVRAEPRYHDPVDKNSTLRRRTTYHSTHHGSASAVVHNNNINDSISATSHAEAKVLDFGLAKLDEDTSATERSRGGRLAHRANGVRGASQLVQHRHLNVIRWPLVWRRSRASSNKIGSGTGTTTGILLVDERTIEQLNAFVSGQANTLDGGKLVTFVLYFSNPNDQRRKSQLRDN